VCSREGIEATAKVAPLKKKKKKKKENDGISQPKPY
jgi:hypothetical protein